ncbi:MAG: glycosyltransferase family 4 protein, partial [Candidatus Poseidoniaceae archaeon]|nr:glycosyltransferase family 4 protein [Candidatus Poseidoniaceae archaeon]
MKVLFLYTYGILGGVCTQLYHRFKGMSDIVDLEIHCGFRNDYGISDMLSPYAKLYFGLNENKTIKLVNKSEFDIIVVIDSEEYVNAIRKSSHEGLVFVEVHTSIDKNLKYLGKLQKDDLDAFIVVSQYINKKINHYVSEAVINKPILTFPNVIDANLFDHRTLPKSPNPIIGWVGKIDNHKDWKTYFRICSLIKRNKPDVEFWIAGGETCSSDLSQEVLSYAEQLDIVSRLRWFDRIETDKMAEFYSTVADSGGLCLVTSHSESFGMSVIESLLSGCPVVATKVGAIPEITEMETYLQFYNLGDVNKALELCLSILEEGIKIDLDSKKQIIMHKYNSHDKSKYYLEILEFFHINELYLEENINHKRIYLSEQSPVTVDIISNPKSIMKPVDYFPSKIKLPESYPKQKLRVACIMDEFSFNSYCDEFELLNLSSSWESELEEFKPDFFFLESAWKGKDFEWEHKINRLDQELLELLNWFRTH